MGAPGRVRGRCSVAGAPYCTELRQECNRFRQGNSPTTVPTSATSKKCPPCFSGPLVRPRDLCQNGPAFCASAAAGGIMEPLQERLTELEIRYAHQAQLVEELNAVVIDFGQRLTRLERENGAFREMFGRLGPALTESPDE
ncbi:MAG TPA: hypothetical protein DCF93_09540 [Desulfuromonas sp.]|nr:hypothetical protein [Desulfuromonas sp.]